MHEQVQALDERINFEFLRASKSRQAALYGETRLAGRRRLLPKLDAALIVKERKIGESATDVHTENMAHENLPTRRFC